MDDSSKKKASVDATNVQNNAEDTAAGGEDNSEAKQISKKASAGL